MKRYVADKEFIAGFAFVLRHGDNKYIWAKPIPLLGKDTGDNISKNRTEILTFRVTPEEKKLIETKALLSYRLVSMYLRDCALDKEIIVIDGVKELTTELRMIGNNLNQITKAVNIGVFAVDLTETKKEVQKIWQSLNSLTRAVR